MNRTVLSATLVERGAARYTPAGLLVCEFKLKHESQVHEAGGLRRISMELRALAMGEVAQRLLTMEMGSHGVYAGFLAHQRNGRGTVLHVTETEPVAGLRKFEPPPAPCI